MSRESTDQHNDSQRELEVLKRTAERYGADWRGTFEMWQNPAFGALCEKYYNQKRIFLGDIQAFISRRPLMGNLSLKIYCLPPKTPLFEIIDAAAKLNVARLWIYSVNEIKELQENLAEISRTYILDLNCESEVLWKNMDSRSRNVVKKAEQKGVLVRAAENEREFNEWWKTYLKTAKAKEFDIQNYDLALALFKDPSLAKLFISLVDGQIAGGFFFLVNHYPIYWLGAFDRKFLEWSPNNLCMWRAIIWFKENSFKLLDLGGAVTDREHGPTQFKKKFGGRLVDAYIYTMPVSRIKNRLLNIITRFYE
jgi:lipid II:glycine glycyltransferase (peptidoglycan interpeptide bridge formation enzyme)